MKSVAYTIRKQCTEMLLTICGRIYSGNMFASLNKTKKNMRVNLTKLYQNMYRHILTVIFTFIYLAHRLKIAASVA